MDPQFIEAATKDQKKCSSYSESDCASSCGTGQICLKLQMSCLARVDEKEPRVHEIQSSRKRIRCSDGTRALMKSLCEYSALKIFFETRAPLT